MAHHRVNDIPPHLLMWRRVREYAVPPSMIETATARREVGDWAGACAAARIDVDLDLRAVRDRHGSELVTRLRADLRRLAPDLLRWHMPRIAPDGRLRPGLTLSLAGYHGFGAAMPQLVVRTPPAWADGGQRMSLALWEGGPGNGACRRHPHPQPHPHPHPDRRFRLDLHRHLWDASRSGELAWRCGVRGAVPATPLDRPDTSERLALPDQPTCPSSQWAVTRWAAEAELLIRAEGRSSAAFAVRFGSSSRAVFELVAPDVSHAPTFRPAHEALPPQEIAALPLLPEAAARILPDLALVRAGLVLTERLHPLVATALGASGHTPVTGPVPGSDDPHRVECRGEIHRIALREGVLAAVDHDPEQLRRENLLVALGGPPLPCLRAIAAAHREPEALTAVRERLGHGDVAGALTVVEGLLGPRAVLRDGPLRDELQSVAARLVEHGLFRSGLVAAPPGRGVDKDGSAPVVDHTLAGHRPRLDRRTDRATRAKRNSRSRPRTGLFD
ncbi:hypothetical protein [Streptomyces montanisoli]|uniref:Uncharacterized protein n=1 Tax=Streptomyces montanisoli TaxID=2798581 RepID=A0A940MCV9_9ACTN|nr:hypothetical protein [Streptomyces montanisoli]MBP0458944.1 hypothetical protein [Streptomyces montanisoli]